VGSQFFLHPAPFKELLETTEGRTDGLPIMNSHSQSHSISLERRFPSKDVLSPSVCPTTSARLLKWVGEILGSRIDVEQERAGKSQNGPIPSLHTRMIARCASD
jgi:hypothetical protein